MECLIRIILLVTICVASSYQQTCRIINNQDIKEQDLKSINGQAQSLCCNLCNGTPGCKGFSWSNFEGGTCWLKTGTQPLVAAQGVNAGILNGGGSSGGALVTYTQFSNAVTTNGYPAPTQAQYAAFIQGLPNGSITTVQEAAMALAQFIHESDGLRAKVEYACVNGCPGHYLTPGCDVPGQEYYGRGYIQLSYCSNYKQASQALLGNDNLVQNPSLVATNENLSWNTAFWFWKVNVHSTPGISSGKFGLTTLAINGPIECQNSANWNIAKLRFTKYGKVRGAFGLPGAGDPSGCYS